MARPQIVWQPLYGFADQFDQALGTVLLTFVIARRLFGEVRAAAAALVLFTSVGFFAMGRLLTPDMLLTFWESVALEMGSTMRILA